MKSIFIFSMLATSMVWTLQSQAAEERVLSAKRPQSSVAADDGPKIDTAFFTKYQSCFDELSKAYARTDQGHYFFLRNGQLVISQGDGVWIYSEKGTQVANGRSCNFAAQTKTPQGFARLIQSLKDAEWLKDVDGRDLQAGEKPKKMPALDACRKIDSPDIQFAIARLNPANPANRPPARASKSAN